MKCIALYNFSIIILVETHHNVKVRIDLVKEELAENVWTRREVAFQLVTNAVSFKIREYKVSYRRETKVVGIDVDHPAIPVKREESTTTLLL